MKQKNLPPFFCFFLLLAYCCLCVFLVSFNELPNRNYPLHNAHTTKRVQ